MNQPSLANAELAVMELLWSQDRMTARDIREQLYPDASRAQHGTVRRWQRDWFSRRKYPRTHHLRPCPSRTLLGNEQTAGFLRWQVCPAPAANALTIETNLCGPNTRH